METIKNRIVTLFYVEGIDESAVRQKPISREEVQELKWIPIHEYIQETMRQNTVESIMGSTSKVPKYCHYYVKSFAYFVSEW
jgi:hypothetical protein